MRMVVVPEPTDAAVVKLQVTAEASACPSEALIVVARFAVYVVEFASAAVGVSVATNDVPLYDTEAGTVEPSGALSVKLELVIVVASIPRENVAVTVVPVETPVAASAGDFDVTVGGPGGAGGAVAGTTSIAAISGSSILP